MHFTTRLVFSNLHHTSMMSRCWWIEISYGAYASKWGIIIYISNKLALLVLDRPSSGNYRPIHKLPDDPWSFELFGDPENILILSG